MKINVITTNNEIFSIPIEKNKLNNLDSLLEEVLVKLEIKNNKKQYILEKIEKRLYKITKRQKNKMQQNSINIRDHYFEVSLSFPGEHRAYVLSVANELENLLGKNTYFYDDNYKSQLATPNLDILLQNIYSSRSKLIVVFLSSEYEKKEWCGLEFRAIKEIIMERNDEKIMFIKMDTCKVSGVFKGDGYIDSKKESPIQVAGLIKERVGFL